MSPLVLAAVYIGILFMSPASQGHDTEGPSESECRPYIEKALQGVNTLQSEDAATILADEIEEGISGEETKLSAEEHGEIISSHDEENMPKWEDGSNTVGEESLDDIGVVAEKSEDEMGEVGEMDKSTEEKTDQPSTEETQTESVEQNTDQQSAEINEEPSVVSEQQESEEQAKDIDESKETILEDIEHEEVEELFDQPSKDTVDDVEEETPETTMTSQEINEQSSQISKEIEDEGDTNVEQQETQSEEALQEEQSEEEPIEKNHEPSEEKIEDEIISENMQHSIEEGEIEKSSQEIQQSEDEIEKEDVTEESHTLEEEEEKQEESDGVPPSEEDVTNVELSAEAQPSEEELEKVVEVDGEEKSEENVESNEEEQSKDILVEEIVKASEEIKSEEESIKQEAFTQMESEEADLNAAEEKEDDVVKSEEVTEEESLTNEEHEESVETVQAEVEEKTVEYEEIQHENVDTKESASEEKLEEVKSAEESANEDTKVESEEQKESVSVEVEKTNDVSEQTINVEKDLQEDVSKEDQEGKKEEPLSEPPEEEELIMVPEMPEKLRGRDHMAQILHLDAETEEIEQILSKTVEHTLKELKKLYDAAIKPLEILYKYRDLSNRHFGDPEIFSKPLILFMGPWSGGKSTIINYLLENEYKTTALRTGADPSPAYFNIVMWGEEPEIVDGTQLAADWTFSGLQKFGQVLLDRLRGLKLNHPLLQKVNIVEIPGILEIRKQVERLFPFNDACQWFIDRADIIFLVYDPSKLDIGPETEAILDQLKGREMQTRIILNKADQVKPEELMRVQGTLIWNISPLMSSTEPPVMYSTSLWSLPYEAGSPTRLLHAQEKAFLTDLRSAIDKRVENKIAGARRFAVRVRNHAKMVDCYLTTYYNHKSFFDNKKHVSDDIIEHPQNYHIYEGLSTLTNISRYDLPDPDVYRDFFRLNPVYEFQQLSATCTYFRGCPINRLDLAIAYDLPELIGKYKKSVEDLLKSHNANK